MTYEELVAWCGYFWDPETRRCRCGYWAEGTSVALDGHECPILQAGNPVFVPEPIRGNPLGKDIVFLAANPGGGALPAPEDELNTCPWCDPQAGVPAEAWENALGNPRGFATFCLQTNERAAIDQSWRRQAYNLDNVSKGATGILAAVRAHNGEAIPIRPRVDSQWFRNNIADVAVLNVAHCKSPRWNGNGLAAIVGTCFGQTLAVLMKIETPVLVALGHVSWEALTSLAPAYATENVPDVERLYILRRLNDRAAKWLVRSPHPTRALNYANRPGVVDAISEALRRHREGQAP